MRAVGSLSVDTTTASNSPLSRAPAIEYAISGCPASTRMFLPATRSDPPRAGISATAAPTGGSSRDRDGPLDRPGIVVDVDRLPVRVDVERLGAGLAPAGARLAQAAERHVRLRAVGGPVDRRDAARDAGEELLAAVHAARPDRRGQAVGRGVR